jgi:uncharacterized protein YdaU (DUF1376 family)
LARDEHGAYLLLLMAYWRNDGPLPDENKRLAAIAKASQKEWKELRPTMAEFFTVQDGLWTHKRVESELAQSKDRKNKAVSKAQTAAEARWGHSKRNAPSNAPSITQAPLEQCPTPSPTPIYSVAKATDGQAVKSPNDLTKTELWSAGKSLLAASGLPAKQCGSFVGKLVKDHGDAIVIEAVRAAVLAQPADPAEYIKAACQHGSGQRQPVNKQIALEQRNRAVAEEWLASQGDIHAVQ